MQGFTKISIWPQRMKQLPELTLSMEEQIAMYLVATSIISLQWISNSPNSKGSKLLPLESKSPNRNRQATIKSLTDTGSKSITSLRQKYSQDTSVMATLLRRSQVRPYYQLLRLMKKKMREYSDSSRWCCYRQKTMKMKSWISWEMTIPTPLILLTHSTYKMPLHIQRINTTLRCQATSRESPLLQVAQLKRTRRVYPLARNSSIPMPMIKWSVTLR